MLALALAALVAATPPVHQVHPDKLFAHQLPAARSSGVSVLLPTNLPQYAPQTGLFPSVTHGRGHYELQLGAVAHCNGADACFVAEFSANRGGTHTGAANVHLNGGVSAWYRPISCGASCAPANLWWRRNGVLYQIQVKDPVAPARTMMIALGNSALAAGAR
jgi:hypothetical protein